ncbi:homeodomain-like protein [Rhizophagus clarus]|uniref:Homeodomain-like protein n=1 Tax=Rhizophagus clarus TaxID=94130 RepID=A0A8H3LNA7_9GLOM|nr:homeodomain-like protein [Rhizophagus clarus]
MPKKLGDDLLWRIIYLNHAGKSSEQIASLLFISKSIIVKTLANYTKWNHIRKSSIKQQGRRKLLNYGEMKVIQEIIQEKPDSYLDELVKEIENRINKTISTSTLSRYLDHCGSQYRPDQLIFIDESSKDERTLNRSYGYSNRGCKLQHNVIFLRGKRYTILPALSLDGYIAVDIIEGSCNKERFKDFILSKVIPQMYPFPGPNSVLIMDNAKIHHNNDFINIVQELGGKVEFLPPYSPDLNPIETSFSVIKSWIKRHRDFMKNFDDPIHALMLACAQITLSEAMGFFSCSIYM